jgi:predicted metal-dependent HD superfamily phosphohydrolase
MNLSSACLADLSQRYAEPHRAYHTLAHIQHALQVLQTVRHLAHNSPAVELALWFHDAIYDPTRPDNEEQSALLANQWLAELGAEPALVQTVHQLILVTKNHLPETNDEKIMVDVDLAILGADAEAYGRYAQAIRQEYHWVPDVAYKIGRAQVLQRFLARPIIFHTPPLFEKYEAQARLNLQQELTQLTTL